MPKTPAPPFEINWDDVYKFVVEDSIGRRAIFLLLVAMLLGVVVAGIGYIRSVPSAAVQPGHVIWLQVLSTLASVLFFAAIYALFDSTSAKQQFEECVQEIRRHEAEQTRFGVAKITRGDKFFKIISSMDVEDGDHIDIMWSFLQHEEVTDNFFRFAEKKNLKVRILIFLPFGYAIRQRAKDVRRSYLEESFSAVAAKSLSNLDFLKRYAHQFHTQSRQIWDDQAPAPKPIDAFSKTEWPLNDVTDLWPPYAVGGGVPFVDLPHADTVDSVRRQVNSFLDELQEGESNARSVKEAAVARGAAGDAASSNVEGVSPHRLLEAFLRDVESEKNDPRMPQDREQLSTPSAAFMAGWTARDATVGEIGEEVQVKGAVAIRFTDRYTARPMVIVRRPLPDGVARTPTPDGKEEEGPPALYVAMGMFLNNESSKYPFIIYRRPTDDTLGGQAAVDICNDAAKHFLDRWENARFWSSVDRFAREVRARFEEFVDDLSKLRAISEGRADPPAGPAK